MSLDVPDPLAVARTALERLPIGILIVSAHGAIVLVNYAAESLFGYERAELIGQTIDLLLPYGSWSQQAGPASGDSTASLQGTPAARDLSGRRKDGSEVPIEVHLCPMTVGDTSLVIVSALDVSERRRLEQELWAVRDGRLQFEMLVGGLGAEFVSLRADDVDRAIDDALERVVRALDLDWGTLFRILENGDFVHTHGWTRPGWTAPPRQLAASEWLPWHLTRLRAGEVVSVSTFADVPHPADRDSLQRLGTRSMLTIPLAVPGRTSAVAFAAARQSRAWAADVITCLRAVALLFTNVLARKQADDALRETIGAATTSRERLHTENAYLRDELQRVMGASTLVGHSAAMRRVVDQVRQVSGTNSTVLLLGEMGTGKSLIAARIHELSARSSHAMVRIRCAALTAPRLEKELFGPDDTSDTIGPRHVGRLAVAHHSTLYLDEVADLPLDTQTTLLRVLQDERAHPQGAAAAGRIDVRVIAATRKDLMRCIEQGTFRHELYVLLNVFPIRLAPLRDRPEDIPLLVWRFVDEFSEMYGKPIDAIDKATMALLQRYTWPGNARELRNVIERAMIVATGRHLHVPPPRDVGGPIQTLAAIEREHITSVLSACDWHVEGNGGAAAQLGMTPRALWRRMATLGIPRRPSSHDGE